MAYLHDEREDDDVEHPQRARERELTLSTGTILAVFFALAVSWGAFYAFGYNMGSKARPGSTAVAATSDTEGTPDAKFANFKPSSGTPAITATPTTVPPATAAAASHAGAAVSAYPAVAPSESSPVKPPPAPRVSPSTATATPESASQPAAVHVAAVPVPRPVPQEPVSAAPTPAGSFMVQVAAVTHQEDADTELSSLRRKGYAVVARSEPQDRYIHIQVGPFANKKDAEAMRQRLIADGYLAIVK